jgi:hypothetical protein
MRLTKVRGKVIQRLRSLPEGAYQHLDPAWRARRARFDVTNTREWLKNQVTK